MCKYLITGRQGSGKTTIITLLQDSGYTAYNTDDLSEATKLQDRITGETIDWPAGKVDWKKYAWNWQKPEIEHLLASDEIVFLGAVVSNQVEFYSLFDKIFVLSVDSATLRQRLETHEHASHHLPGEIERILTNHDTKQKLLISEGAELISGDHSPSEIVGEILKKIGLESSNSAY